MMEKKCLVVGANSFLGRAVVEQLLEKGSRVEGVFHQNRANLLPQVVCHSMEEIWQLSNDYEELYLISAHVPNNQDEGAAQLAKLHEVNVQLPQRIVTHFSQAKIIYSSSVAVYGERQKVVHEDSVIQNPSPYGKSKWQGEQCIKEAQKYAIVRISSMYGVGMKEHTFLPNSIKQAIQQQTIPIWGAGSRAQNYIYVQDVANYLLLAAAEVENGIYLAVDELSYTNLEVAKIIQEQVDCSIKMFGEDHSSSYYYQNQITNQKLDYAPPKKLKQNLTTIIQWLKKKYS